MTDATRRSEKSSRENTREEKIPEQSRIEELAEYFDRTDVSDPDTWEEADDAVIERPELEQISVRLPKEDLEHIRRRAARAGVGYTTYHPHDHPGAPAKTPSPARGRSINGASEERLRRSR